MAVTLHTNSGFVTVAPTADPAGSADVVTDGAAIVTKDTAPAGAVKITEVGWYKSVGTTSSNTQVGLYAADGATVPGEAGTRLQVTGDAASGTSAGWIRFTGLDWPVTAGVDYWLGMQQDAHTGSSDIDSATSGGAGIDRKTSQTALTNPFAGGALGDVDGMYAIYALYQTAPTTALNSPADSATGVDTLPQLQFTGTDAESDDVTYEVQVNDSNFVDIAKNNLTTGSDITGVNSTTTASISPGSNRPIFAFVKSRMATGSQPSAPTLTGLGLTWTLVKSLPVDNAGTSRQTMSLFRASGASPTPGVITIDFSGVTQTHIGWIVDEILGADNSTSDGVVQEADNTYDSSHAADTQITATLAAFSSSRNATYAVLGNGNNTASPAVGSGFTEVGRMRDDAGGSMELVSEFLAGNDTTADFTFASDLELGIIAVEVKAASILIDALSATDAGFADITNGADTDPFASGDQIGYQVQSADILSASTLYYWRARAKDPSGSNTWGAWATTRSFTTTSGGGVTTHYLSLLGVGT